ncbi:protein yellow-like [Anopheles stephensi]|uniref:protein yellow-like n=1 Tax=Anopheles stephensi TaxID=30069 RepID=UPI0016589A1B|nr:protein yellow-like [Anopheles stephensi]XP_035901856.1 protein yellow-like [Anopheles stephensi]XP_035901857.1 protein yellow-like [Anopheles stephensi]XP_035901859.1 protein yellow-like [Anopheles stephensi]XP_035901860.1 protein yellow-like [Anopheles stephensi]
MAPRSRLVLQLLLLILPVQLTWGQYFGQQLKSVIRWQAADFAFPTPQERQQALASGRYIPDNCLPLDMDVDYSNPARSRLFVTIPRFVDGIPYTLGRVSKTQGPSGPLIEPYPNAAIQAYPSSNNCDGIVSVFRIKIDECNRMWILDTGKIGEKRICLPQLVVYDMKTDTMVHRYRIPADQLVCELSLLVNLLVDVQDPSPLGSCKNTKVYMADVTAPAMIVYDMAKGKSWRITNKQMHPNPDYGTFTIANESFDLMDGIVAMALSPRIPSDNVVFSSNYGTNWRPSNDRLMYFHALASLTENAVRTSVLLNDTIWEENTEALPRAFRPIGTRPSQTAAQAMDSNGNLFFGLVAQNAIACWDSTTPYNPSNMRIISQNSETLQFPSGVKIVRNRKGAEELWVLTCRLQKFLTGTLNTNETNFRIQAIQIPELLGYKSSCRV